VTSDQTGDVTSQLEDLTALLSDNDLAGVAAVLGSASAEQITPVLVRLNARQRAVAYRLLPKDRASEVFEDFSPALRSDLVRSLRDAEVAAIFADLEPDDRVWLLDELPASLAPRLLRGLPARERELTAAVLGYPQGSIGRRMSPEYVSARPQQTAGEALAQVHTRLDDAETVYTLPVRDDVRHVVGVVSLRDLLRADPRATVSELMRPAQTAAAEEDAEIAARRCAGQGLLALPVVDSEQRLVGILTIDDAVRILEHEESEDAARQGGVEPLRRPYLATPILRLVRTRVVWLLVLAIGATLTVQVLEVFEGTLEQVTVLALFVPLLIGTGGNTGNQAATTVTRALALDDVSPRDLLQVLSREVRVGFCLGALLGTGGLALTALAYEPQIGLVIGLTLLVVCTMAASVGGVMPLIARAVRVDPAVFSNPFITTFVDATGLVVYFLIARAILGI
jgi:magnesium transporter